jgi:hypothetical protein
MTQALNLALLANKVNTSGQLDGPTGVTGAVPSATTTANITGGTQGQVPVQSAAGTTTFMDSSFAFKNRIINGAMVIDQRNAGAEIFPVNDGYMLDRWKYNSSQASKFKVQQNAALVTPPAGFPNYMGFTVASAVTVGSTDNFMFSQRIEGFNFADLNWGTANAKTVTLSAWVYSSLTGTFGGSLMNSAENRSYPFTYTISSANTWTQISVTIAGDTTGTWIGATNGIGLKVWFSLGMGSTYSGTAGTWAGATYFSATGAVSVVGTGSATFYITGVQLEKGSTATSFDYRPYGTELALCQRYYVRIVSDASYSQFGIGVLSGSAAGSAYFPFPVTMRAVATSVDFSGIATCSYPSAAAVAITGFTLNAQQTKYAGNVSWTTGSSAGSTGNPIQIIANNNASAYVGFGAEL